MCSRPALVHAWIAIVDGDVRDRRAELGRALELGLEDGVPDPDRAVEADDGDDGALRDPPLNAADVNRAVVPGEDEELVAVDSVETRAVPSLPVVTTCSPSALNATSVRRVGVAREDRCEAPVARAPDAAPCRRCSRSPPARRRGCTRRRPRSRPARSACGCAFRSDPDHTRTRSSAPPVSTRRLSGEIAAERAPGCAVRVSVRPLGGSTSRAPTGLDARRRRDASERDRRRERGGHARDGVDDAVPTDDANAPVATGDERGAVGGERRIARRDTRRRSSRRRRRQPVVHDDAPSSVTATTTSPPQRRVEERRADVDDRLGLATASSARRSARSDAIARDSSRRLQREHEAQLRDRDRAPRLRSRRARSPSPSRACSRASDALRERVERHRAHRRPAARRRLR